MTLIRDSMRDQIKRVLLDRILDGTYKPGDRLVELTIAEELNTSQAPVREALRDLEGLGVVESERYRGTRVREIGKRELIESYQIRAVLEQLAAEQAAKHLKGKTADLKKALDGILEAAKAQDLRAYSQADMEFHRLIVHASGNSLLPSVWESVALESRFRVAVFHIKHPDMENNARVHSHVFDALERGDGKSAGALLRNVIETVHSQNED